MLPALGPQDAAVIIRADGSIEALGARGEGASNAMFVACVLAATYQNYPSMQAFIDAFSQETIQ